MNKLFFFLPLFACLHCSTQEIAAPRYNHLVSFSAEQSLPPIPPSMTDMGLTENVSWVCYEEDYNPDLLWITCDFHNKTKQAQQMTLDISIHDRNNILLDHRPISSGAIQPGGMTKQGYTSFTKKRRDALLIKCGNNSSQCTLITQPNNE